MPNYAIALVLIGVAAGSSVAGLLVVRRFVPGTVLQPQHDVASPKFQVIGTLYAVLLAFVVVSCGSSSRRRASPSTWRRRS